jgi:electron transport complex protein RnfD
MPMSLPDKEKTAPHEAIPELHVAPSPHLSGSAMTTRSMMIDVTVGLTPVIIAAVFFFQWLAVFQLVVTVGGCLGAEFVFQKMRGQQTSLSDFSALVTGIILGLSLPATAPWYVGLIAAVVAMGIGKAVFGGIGMNMFNPAMVGRAFVMISFAGSLAASGYVDTTQTVDALSQATPLNAFKQGGLVTPLGPLFWGATNGSIGETSALASLLGGLYLCLRRSAAWQIPLAVILGAALLGGIADLMDGQTDWGVIHHLSSGALLFGAFFIATDPTTSPLTARGKWLFGLGIGFLVMILRLFSGYPEGLMFAVLLMNALTPLINRRTIPTPFGGAD